MTAVLHQHTFSAHGSFQEAAFLGRVISVCPGFKTTEGGWQPPFSPLYDVFSYKGRNCSLPGFCLSAAQMQAVPCAHSHPHDSHGHGDPPRPLTSGGLTRGGSRTVSQEPGCHAALVWGECGSSDIKTSSPPTCFKKTVFILKQEAAETVLQAPCRHRPFPRGSIFQNHSTASNPGAPHGDQG